MLLLLSADFFSKLAFSNNSFKNTIRMSNGLDPDQDKVQSVLIAVQIVAKVISRRQKSPLARKELYNFFSIWINLIRQIHTKLTIYMLGTFSLTFVACCFFF